jgi:ankyrin repeat protein
MITSAAQAGDLESLRIWARQVEGVCVTTAKPLCVAARGGYLEVLRCLVQELGADVNQTHHGTAALMIAAASDFSDMVRLLVTDVGADINHGDRRGVKPLHMSASKGNLAVVRCLIQLGASIRAVDALRSTALHVSARYGEHETMLYLLGHTNANLDDVN